jgi:hypothetical protein
VGSNDSGCSWAEAALTAAELSGVPSKIVVMWPGTSPSSKFSYGDLTTFSRKMELPTIPPLSAFPRKDEFPPRKTMICSLCPRWISVRQPLPGSSACPSSVHVIDRRMRPMFRPCELYTWTSQSCSGHYMMHNF